MTRGRVVGVLAVLLLAAAPATAQQGFDCERCHGELELLRQYVENLEEARALLVPEDLLHGSGHTDMTCSECHTGFGSFPHVASAVTETCESCHEEVAAEAGVPRIENKPLARALFAAGRVGEPIPEELYVAVAEVLAFVIRQRERAGVSEVV